MKSQQLHILALVGLVGLMCSCAAAGPLFLKSAAIISAMMGDPRVATIDGVEVLINGSVPVPTRKAIREHGGPAWIYVDDNVGVSWLLPQEVGLNQASAYPAATLKCGAKLEVAWTGPTPHNVWWLSSGQCPTGPGSWKAGQGNVVEQLVTTQPRAALSKVNSDGLKRLTSTNGAKWIACSVGVGIEGEHCLAGMIMQINVEGCPDNAKPAKRLIGHPILDKKKMLLSNVKFGAAGQGGPSAPADVSITNQAAPAAAPAAPAPPATGARQPVSVQAPGTAVTAGPSQGVNVQAPAGVGVQVAPGAAQPAGGAAAPTAAPPTVQPGQPPAGAARPQPTGTTQETAVPTVGAAPSRP